MGRFLLSRRRFLAAGTAAVSLPVRTAAAPASFALRDLLNRAAILSSRPAALRLLKAADSARFGRADAAILLMIVRGMEREAALRSAFPFGRADAGSPYAVSQRHGAWLDAKAGADPLVLSRRLDEETEMLSAGAAHGIILPRFLLDTLIAAERARLSGPAAPALARQIALLESLRPKAPPEPGVGRLPGGRDYYALRLACTTGSDLTPPALERQVSEETDALAARADRLLRPLGLTQGSVGARLRALKSRGPLYANDETGRAGAIAGMNAALARLRPHLPHLFNPPFEPQAGIRRMSPADEAAGRRGYRDPPTATAPGIYYPDLSDVHDRPPWTLTTIAYHETIPGHMIQLRRQALADPHLLQRIHAPGYLEGWAIHAESLADRIGLLSAVGQIGYLQSRLFRLARVTADLGLHLHGWSRARALHFLSETIGFELFFSFEEEVDRYAVEPAAFAGDALVALTLARLSPRSAAALPAFHDFMLNRGPVSAETLPALGSSPALMR